MDNSYDSCAKCIEKDAMILSLAAELEVIREINHRESLKLVACCRDIEELKELVNGAEECMYMEGYTEWINKKKAILKENK